MDKRWVWMAFLIVLFSGILSCEALAGSWDQLTRRSSRF